MENGTSGFQRFREKRKELESKKHDKTPEEIERTKRELGERDVRWFNEAEGDRKELNCPKCRNKGIVAFLTEDGYLSTKPCECAKKRDAVNRIRKSGLSHAFKNYTFQNFRRDEPYQKEMAEKAVHYLRDSERKDWFYIGGQVGCGKTHICTAMCRKLIARHKDVIYMQWVKDAGRLKAIKNECEYQTEAGKLMNCDVLYIDDFFKTETGKAPTSGDVNLAFEIINHRYINRLQTIISSEKMIDEILDIDEATGSRIRELCAGFIISVARKPGRNMRLNMEGEVC